MNTPGYDTMVGERGFLLSGGQVCDMSASLKIALTYVVSPPLRNVGDFADGLVLDF